MSKLITKRPSKSQQGRFHPRNLLTVPDPQPGMAYKWIRVDQNHPLYGGKDSDGWKVRRVSDVETGSQTDLGPLNEFDIKGGGLVRRGDLVLGEMPQEERDALVVEQQEAANRQREAMKAKKPLFTDHLGQNQATAPSGTEEEIIV